MERSGIAFGLALLQDRTTTRMPNGFRDTFLAPERILTIGKSSFSELVTFSI